jgi:hypothetical protein
MTTTHDDLDTMRLSDATEVGAREGGEKHYFGEIAIVDVWAAAWPRGFSKPVPFDAGIHRPDEKRIFVQLKVVCTKKDGGTYDLDQGEVTSGSKHRVTLKSLEALGVATIPELRALAGARWCQVVRVPTGRKFAAKKDSADGSIKIGDMIAEQALKFVALYANPDECHAAETAFYTPKNGDGRNQPQPVTAADTGSAPTIAREQLLATLPAIWQASGKNPAMLGTILAGNPAYAQAGITLTAPEVVALTGQAA